jgi:hypothetical protein
MAGLAGPAKPSLALNPQEDSQFEKALTQIQGRTKKVSGAGRPGWLGSQPLTGWETMVPIRGPRQVRNRCEVKEEGYHVWEHGTPRSQNVLKLPRFRFDLQNEGSWSTAAFGRCVMSP